MRRKLAPLVVVIGLSVMACGDDSTEADDPDVEEQTFSRCEALAAPVELSLPHRTEDVEAGDLRVSHALTALWHVQHHDVLLFLDPSAASGTLDAVADAVTPLAEGEVVTMDAEETYAEFLVLFADQPQITETVSPDVLPPSVRFDLSEPLEDEDRLSSLDGVRDVTLLYDRRTPGALIDALLDDPDAVARLQALDDPLADDVAVLVDAAHRWSEAEVEARTRGGLFDRSERARIREAAARVATGVHEECRVAVVPEIVTGA